VSGVFITGTDTGCGKTSFACALARAGREAGLRVQVCKPVETGCQPTAGGLEPADALMLAAAAGDPRPIDEICPLRLELPAAPEIAARHEEVSIQPERLRAACRSAEYGADFAIVEGAGGLLVPIARGFDMADLARDVDLPLIVVARAALGTINHTRLTLEAAQARGLEVAGVVFSHTAPILSEPDRANLDLLLESLHVPCLGELPFLGATHPTVTRTGKSLPQAPDFKAIIADLRNR